jgi:hypothetical protein
MHLTLILLTIATVFCLRFTFNVPMGNWQSRWQRALGLTLFVPLLLGVTAIAVMLMGTNGYMLGLPVGWMGYLIALGFLGYAGIMLGLLLWGGWRSLQGVKRYSPLQFPAAGYILETPNLFAAQVGFWNSHLVVSRGLLETLSEEQIEAVIIHETAHRYYRDTFWFFWLGWLRQITAWLPNSESLWQELLLLRELRADRWAAQQVDGLLLAESLLWVAQDTAMDEEYGVAFSAAIGPTNRLEERIEALITGSEPMSSHYSSFIWLFIALVPLLTLLLHH